jgi:putative DNA primase/helicase
MATDRVHGVPIDFDGPVFTKTPLPESERESGAPIAAASELDGPDGLHLTHRGNSERFLRDYRQDVLWVEGPNRKSAGTFYVWDGQRWKPDNAGAVALAKATIDSLSKLIQMGLDAGLPSDSIGMLARFWKSCDNDHAIDEILDLAKWDVRIKQGEFNADPDLLGVINGVVDLSTGKLREARRQDLITKQANVIFDAAAICPLWEKFLLETTQGNHALICYLQQCCGISLTGDTSQHLLFFIIGPGGTGKSTFCETIQYVWGNYATGLDPDAIAASMRTEGGRAKPDIARLPGTRLAYANETRKGLQLDAGLVKALTGGDTITARGLHQAPFDFKPSFKIWLRSNEEPQFDGGDTGMQRRVKKIPFTNKVITQDAKLPEKLRGEAGGILNWAIRGLISYQQRGLIEVEIIRTETAEYIKSLDIVAQFLDEKCEIDLAHRQPAGELYDCYRAWIEKRGQKALGSPRFRADLQAKGFRQEDDRAGSKIWYGILLRSTT